MNKKTIMFALLVFTLAFQMFFIAPQPAVAEEQERIEITILKGKAENEVPYDQMFIWDDMSEKFGIEFVWDNPAAADFETRYNLIINNPSDLPDVIMDLPITDVQRRADEGLIIPLNDLIENNMPDLKALFEEYPVIPRALTYPDGNIYYFAQIDESPSGNMPFGIRLDWLEKLGIEERPVTIEDWEAYWEKVKTEDPNGNGEADEIPFSAGAFASVRAFASAFGVVDDYDKTVHNFYRDPEANVIKYGPIQPEYKEFLTWMSDMFAKGYIDPQIVTMTSEIYSSAMAQNLVGSMRGPLGGNFVNFNAQMGANIEGFRLGATEPPLAPEGAQIHISIDQFPRGNAAATITNNAENPERIAEWINYMYSYEGATLVTMGHEGETYEMGDNDMMVYSDFIQKNPDGLSPKQAVGTFSLVQSTGPFLFLKDAPASLDDDSVREAKNDYIIPFLEESNEYVLSAALAFDADASEELRNGMIDIKSYTDQNILAFITGEKSLDDWDDYVATVESMGIERMVELHQIAYDAWASK